MKSDFSCFADDSSIPMVIPLLWLYVMKNFHVNILPMILSSINIFPYAVALSVFDQFHEVFLMALLLADTDILCQITCKIGNFGLSMALLNGEVNGGFEMYGGHFAVSTGLIPGNPANVGLYIGIKTDRSAVLVEFQLCGIAVRVIVESQRLIPAFMYAIQNIKLEFKHGL